VAGGGHLAGLLVSDLKSTTPRHLHPSPQRRRGSSTPLPVSHLPVGHPLIHYFQHGLVPLARERYLPPLLAQPLALAQSCPSQGSTVQGSGRTSWHRTLPSKSLWMASINFSTSGYAEAVPLRDHHHPCSAASGMCSASASHCRVPSSSERGISSPCPHLGGQGEVQGLSPHPPQPNPPPVLAPRCWPPSAGPKPQL
jgi:hypothetical protein